MDFVTGLPLDGGFNRLMVCVEKLTKLTHLILCFVGGRDLNSTLSCGAVFCSCCVFFWYTAGYCPWSGPSLYICFLEVIFCHCGHHDCNLVARSIYSLMDKLSARTEPLNNCFNQWQLIKNSKWVSHVPFVEFALNSSKWDSTQKTPF